MKTKKEILDYAVAKQRGYNDIAWKSIYNLVDSFGPSTLADSLRKQGEELGDVGAYLEGILEAIFEVIYRSKTMAMVAPRPKSRVEGGA